MEYSRLQQKTRSTPLGDLDPVIRFAEGKFFQTSQKLIQNRGFPAGNLACAQSLSTIQFMLTAKPTSCFSWNYTVSEHGKIVATVKVSWLRNTGSLQVGRKSYVLYRQALSFGPFVAECDGKAVAEADKPSVFRRRFSVRFAGRVIELKALSLFSRTFGVYENGIEIGDIGTRHIFTRKATINMPKDVPLDVQVFCFWLAVLIWRRQSKNAAG